MAKKKEDLLDVLWSISFELHMMNHNLRHEEQGCEYCGKEE